MIRSRPEVTRAPLAQDHESDPSIEKVKSTARTTKRSRAWLEILRREFTGLFQIVKPRLYFWTLMARFLPDFSMATLRTQFFRLAGCRIHPGVSIMGSLRLIGGGDIASRLQIGEGTMIAPDVKLGLDANITIGNNVSISPFTTIYTATHALGMGSRRMGLTVTPKPVIIEDGVWIGMQCLILPGVSIGKGAVVAAGSVVSCDVEPNTLVAGNPAKFQQKLPFGNR